MAQWTKIRRIGGWALFAFSCLQAWRFRVRLRRRSLIEFFIKTAAVWVCILTVRYSSIRFAADFVSLYTYIGFSFRCCGILWEGNEFRAEGDEIFPSFIRNVNTFFIPICSLFRFSTIAGYFVYSILSSKMFVVCRLNLSFRDCLVAYLDIWEKLISVYNFYTPNIMYSNLVKFLLKLYKIFNHWKY